MAAKNANAVMPETDEADAPNLVDVNGAAGVMDEDGEAEVSEEDLTPIVSGLAVKTFLREGKEYTEIVANVHMAALHGPEEEYEVRAVSKDVDGRVQKDPETGQVLYVTETKTHCPVIRPGGIHSKRLVLPGNVTALQLAQHIYTIADW
jgi:hypothetical protein